MIETDEDLVTLFRPVGHQELKLIRQSDYLRFPPRLPEQPIFYPVVTEEYAIQIARDWNAKYNDPKFGCVTRFRVRRSFLDRYKQKTVGGRRIENIGFLPKTSTNSTEISWAPLKSSPNSETS